MGPTADGLAARRGRRVAPGGWVRPAKEIPSVSRVRSCHTATLHELDCHPLPNAGPPALASRTVGRTVAPCDLQSIRLAHGALNLQACEGEIDAADRPSLIEGEPTFATLHEVVRG
jgi:hypothetical protein